VPELTLHALPPSHPCMTVDAALRLKGLEFERVDLQAGSHNEEMERLYGSGATTVPGLMVDDDPVHGSRAILARLEQVAPDPPLFPAERSDAVREAERWGDEELQDLGRRLPWAALYFRPESMGTFAGGDPLDPPGTDFAMRYVRATWKYHGITAERLAGDLAGLPAKVAHVEELAADGTVDGDEPTAADLQIGATVRVLLTVGDLDPLLLGTAAERIARRWFPEYPGRVPPGAYPAGWVPAATTA
jgi:glutathione S-transferase